MNNDANAGALAEFMFGKYKGTRELIYLTLSTGIGGGIITNGKLIQGVTDMGGEVGHHTLDINGPPCPCGRAGCFEVYVGGKNVADRLREKIRAGKIRTSILDKAGGDLSKIDHKALVAAAREGDAFAVAEWDVFIERLAQGVGNLMMIINPELVILGTIAVFEGEFLLAPLRERVKKYAWKWPIEACRIVPSSLGADIGNYAALAVGADGIRQG
jgi:glucokinase